MWSGEGLIDKIWHAGEFVPSYATVRSRARFTRAHTGLFPDAADCPTKSSLWVSSASSAAVRSPASRELTSLFDAVEFL